MQSCETIAFLCNLVAEKSNFYVKTKTIMCNTFFVITFQLLVNGFEVIFFSQEMTLQILNC